MFDEYARRLIDMLPDLPEINRIECRRALSIVYFYVLRSKLALENDDFNKEDLEKAQHLLRKMVDALESVAVFDRFYGQNRSEEVENACAFVAAEALSLLSYFPIQAMPNTFPDPILDDSIYTKVEAALLYMAGGFDINAVTIVSELGLPIIDGTTISQDQTIRLSNANALLSRLIHFSCGNARLPRQTPDFIPITNDDGNLTNIDVIINKIRSDLYLYIGEGIDHYLNWLGGYDDDGKEHAIQILNHVRNSSITPDQPAVTIFADIFHLCSLILVSINRTSERSLIHRIPFPISSDEVFQSNFVEYLHFRVRGDENHRSRPFLWPSSLEYIRNCLPGPNRDAVISMPTGSGKSYIAEIAAIHALNSGWVLYLAPTNALVYQIRRDLIYALRPFRGISVRAFIGSEEYTTLSEEQIQIQDNKFVAVMTPEKCSLALKLFPDIFTNCSLCIFDECHLINDDERGITADILIAQLSVLGRSMHFILMSAMISNPDQLAGWLVSIHDNNATPLKIKWRPSRTLRGLLLVDRVGSESNYSQAREILGNLPSSRVNYHFNAPLALIAGLSGPWTLDGPPDYRITTIPINFIAKASRRNGQIEKIIDSWKNTSSRQLAEFLAGVGIPTICFIISSRHHTFSLSEKVNIFFPESIGEEGNFPELVDAWLSISDTELGVPTKLRELLRKGIAVHSSAMLQTEQSASEWMFLNKKASLMFATSTLAQGLNLPAVAVIIAGTSMGDARYEVSGIERINSLILNSFGRAGRPGFSNQGVAILVSDNPYYANISPNLDPTRALQKYEVLGEEDAAIEIHSPIEVFIDNILAGNLDLQMVSQNELVLTTFLTEYNDDNFHSGNILNRTLAAYYKRQQLPPNSGEIFRDHFMTLRANYFIQPNFPEWLNKAAMVAGVDYFRAQRVWQAYNQRGLVTLEELDTYSVDDWVEIFFEVMSFLPPKQILIYLPDPEYRTNTILKRMGDKIINQTTLDEIPWEIPDGWIDLWQEFKDLVLMYLHGESYSSIAQIYLNLNNHQINNKRSKGNDPIPAVFGFIQRIIYQLAIDAGCFIAILEMGMTFESGASLPETLQALSLCIRHGCDSLGTLAWYRFGYRQRACAHALQRSFPVPQEIINDSERSEWVKETKRNWLASEIPAEDPLINYAKIILTQVEN